MKQEIWNVSILYQKKSTVASLGIIKVALNNKTNHFYFLLKASHHTRFRKNNEHILQNFCIFAFHFWTQKMSHLPTLKNINFPQKIQTATFNHFWKLANRYKSGKPNEKIWRKVQCWLGPNNDSFNPFWAIRNFN